MTNDQLINEAIAILQTMNMEDCALAIHNLREEHNRVRIIAHGRLVKISNLQHEVAEVEDELTTLHRRANDLEKISENRLERIMNLLSAIDPKDFKTIQKDNELAAVVDRELAHLELGREPRTHLELGL